MNKHLIFYRGPLERSRLSVIIESILKTDVPADFVWVFPGVLSKEKEAHASGFLSQYNFGKIIFKSQNWKKFLTTRKELYRLINSENYSHVSMVGFSAPFFIKMPGKSIKKIWFINGIPEEKLVHDKSFITKIISSVLWKVQGRQANPNLTVTVSKRMSAYVQQRTGINNILEVPTCTSLDVFKPKQETSRKYFTYLGSGAGWQAIDLLEKVWYEIHRQNPAVLFRVISRDARCKMLGNRIPASNIEFVQSSDFSVVASYLHEAEVGFLIRRDSIVNRVCFPTKLGEYLASGSWVVSSKIDWDLAEYFSQYNIGLLVDPESNPVNMAAEILSYRQKVLSNPASLNIESCAAVLDRAHWVGVLKNRISIL